MVIRVPEERNTLGGYAVLDDRLLVLDFQAGNPQAFVEITSSLRATSSAGVRAVPPDSPGRRRGLPRDDDPGLSGPLQVQRPLRVAALGRPDRQERLPRHPPWSCETPPGRRRASPTEDLAGPDDEAQQIVERLVQHDTVLAVLSDLPETHRRALMMRELDGHSHREIAQEMEISTGQAKALIHRAKLSFRKRWLEKVAERGGFMGIGLLPLCLAPSDRGWLASVRRPSRPLGTGGAGRGTGGGQLDGGNGGGAGRVERSGRACGRGGDDVALGRWRDRWCGQDRRG